jgi:NAD(P)H-hydrate repair Nnr-like enzyme with NAD(P)H-hydrate dehydratase domain
MNAPTGRWHLGALGIVAAAAAFGFGLVLIVHPAPAPRIMDQYGAELACETYIRDQLRSTVTFQNVQVLNFSPVFVVKGTYSDAYRPDNHWSCRVVGDGQQWHVVSIHGPGLGSA